MADRQADWRQFRLLSLLDDVNREGLGIEVDLLVPAERVVRSLNQIIDVHQIATECLWACNNERSDVGMGGLNFAIKPTMAA
ncbi:hypothetical protein GCM10010991_35530 [Gemmobacter aquaticus]|uniref:Uncharacterized protein n=1 Tax=Gemmobacter aquaticus TaxID=490185 RepID=A0A917YMY3_9RHOB|nr:hypothetical protein GCM10010991_35530 [Gemmobacter aquaticus]